MRSDYVSKVVGIQPTEEQQRGESIRGSKAIAKIGLWALVAQTKSRSIPEQMDELLTKIGSPTKPLDQIDGVDEAYLDIFVTPDYEHQEREPVEGMLTREHLTALDRLGLCLQFTMS
ncbi:MAG: DUF4279 domain-containing protein [Blastocatellia bacterium]|nr:DUF4279 domain-containing protein [Blastocatellia bacterium]